MAKKSGDYYIQVAEKNGCEVKCGKGDHYKVYSPEGYDRSMMVVPRNLKGNGTENAIRKWLMKFGIVCALIFVFLVFILPILA